MQPPFIPPNPGDRVTGEPPPVLLYYRLYAGLMVALYVLVVLAGAFMIVAGTVSSSRSRGMPPWMTGIICVVVGLPLAIAFGVGVIGGRARWRHTYGLVLIAIGMTSACCLPAALPLLIYWMKPEMKAWFNE